MKKANVNLFDKNQVQVKLLKNKNLRITDGRKHPTKIVNLRKTGITIWTDGNHLKIFRGNCLTEVIGRSIYRANKFQKVKFIGAVGTEERRPTTNLTTNFVGASNIQEGLIVQGSTASFVGASNIQEGLIVQGSAASFVGASNIQEGRSSNSQEDILIIGAKDASEGRSLEGAYAVYIGLTDKSVTIRHGKV